MIIKICGVTHPEDAAMAASLGANLIGVIFDPSSKRYVDIELARAIVPATIRGGAEAVAVFVDTSLQSIIDTCKQTGIKRVQLHHRSAEHAQELLQLGYLVTVSVGVEPDGSLRDPIGVTRGCTPLYDNVHGGLGRPFNWTYFQKPQEGPWFLAGGLTPDNIEEAIRRLEPSGVDVASGVEREGSRKDPVKMKQFINKARTRQIDMSKNKYGGQYLPEILVTPLLDLQAKWEAIKTDQEFMQEFHALLHQYAGRPTPLTEVPRFAEAIGAPRLFLKREDLLHTGAHKINNALGQCLLAKRLGKTRIIAETGAGQHGVATATACARLGLDCVVFMGSVDIARQKPNVDKMKLLRATVVPVSQGSATLKDAINETLRDWSHSYETTHYCLGSALGPHPYPEMVRTFQTVIGLEVQQQVLVRTHRRPDLLIACVGGGSNAIGFFAPFLDDKQVQLIGVEAGGIGLADGQHAARFSRGVPGVLHGCYTYLLQDAQGQVLPTHSVSAGLDYPAVGPEHASLHDSGRAIYVTASDEEALAAFQTLTRTEGIIPALESSHALAYIMKVGRTLCRDAIVVVNLSGRGDKDLAHINALNQEAAHVAH